MVLWYLANTYNVISMCGRRRWMTMIGCKRGTSWPGHRVPQRHCHKVEPNLAAGRPSFSNSLFFSSSFSLFLHLLHLPLVLLLHLASASSRLTDYSSFSSSASLCHLFHALPPSAPPYQPLYVLHPSSCHGSCGLEHHYILNCPSSSSSPLSPWSSSSSSLSHHCRIIASLYHRVMIIPDFPIAFSEPFFLTHRGIFPTRRPSTNNKNAYNNNFDDGDAN